MTDVDREHRSAFLEPLNSDQTCCNDDTNCGLPEQNVVDPANDFLSATTEPCPPPLIWQEVRESFLKESEFWEVRRGPHRLIGRTFGTGLPLYFANHFAGTAELFSLVLWLLRDEFRCVVFDTYTENSKAARQSKPDMETFAADLFAVADEHGDRRFTAYGAGFGAAVLLKAALTASERFERLVLQHGFMHRRLTIFERWLASACLRSNQILDRLPQRRRFQAVNHKPWFPPFDQTRFDFLLESTGKLPLRDLARRALAVSTFNITGQLENISCPVTLIRTEGEGRLAADSQILLEKGLKNPHVEWLHSAGQHPYLTHPHRIAKLVRSEDRK